MLVPGVLHEGTAGISSTGGNAVADGRAGAEAEPADESTGMSHASAAASPRSQMKRSLSGRSLTDEHTEAEKAAMVADAVKGVPEAIGADEKAPWMRPRSTGTTDSASGGETRAPADGSHEPAGSDAVVVAPRVASGDAWPKLSISGDGQDSASSLAADASEARLFKTAAVGPGALATALAGSA